MFAAIPFPHLSNELFAVDLFGFHLALRWYALAYLAGLVFGFLAVRGLMRRPGLWPAGRAPLDDDQMDDLLTAMILGVILGGRLGYVLAYEPAKYLAHPLDIVKVWEGGMSFHGGFLGVVAAGLLFSWRRGVPALQLGDALALVAPVGLFLGRIANFINAELWGRPTELPWGVIFPGAAAQDCPGLAPGLCARHPSQLYEAGLEGLLLGLVLFVLFRRGALRQPGTLTGTFLIGYGLSRLLVELVRQADGQFITPANPMGYVLQAGAFGLSMGQLLSLPMVAAGLWLLLRRAPG
ncbi:MAG: prolipoprotein diacylglyceryl transferase [Defluviimonas sp.]|uniref:prolipoprotein diacylglyceryl transferase n=1 Tax=Albidovulum sp. TaxID=1872424 RepID=UPI002A2A6ABD|nr:prolipoprotein diacylglyceryl transferase [Defluviimonas sp.]